MIELMPQYQYKKLIELSNIENNCYIIYDLKTKKFDVNKNINEVPSSFFNESNNYQIDNEILIFIRDMFLENVIDKFKIKDAINNCSFSVKNTTEENLLKYISSNPKINFLEDEINIIENIRTSMQKDNNTQAKKYYNSILKQLKFTRLDLLEKTAEQRSKNFKDGLKKRDKEIAYKKTADYQVKQITQSQDLDTFI